MTEWLKKKWALKEGQITQEEYMEWKLNWPDTASASQNNI